MLTGIPNAREWFISLNCNIRMTIRVIEWRIISFYLYKNKAVSEEFRIFDSSVIKPGINSCSILKKHISIVTEHLN